MPIFSKTIGIVGGAGPVASAFLYRKILEICQKQYKANDYNEFPQIIIVSYPFTRGNREKIQKEITLCFSKLKAAGADLLCIACNSFHGFLPDLSGIYFIHLVNEGIQEAIRLKISRALILSAQGTIDMKLYEQSGLQCTYPSKENQKRINQIIREVAEGIVTPHQSADLKHIIAHCYAKEPFDGIILACTELPLVHKNSPISQGEGYPSMPVVDTVETLAKSLVALSL